MEFQFHLFQTLKVNVVKVLHSIHQRIWKTQQWLKDWAMLVFIRVPMKVNAKECSHLHTITLISHASKITLKILQARLQQYMNWELPDVQAGFRKGRRTKDQTGNMLDHRKSKRIPEKHLLLLNWLKSLTVWVTITVENSSKDGNAKPPYLSPAKPVCRSKSNN